MTVAFVSPLSVATSVEYVVSPDFTGVVHSLAVSGGAGGVCLFVGGGDDGDYGGGRRGWFRC